MSAGTDRGVFALPHGLFLFDIFTDHYIGGADPYFQVLTAQTMVLPNERNDVDTLRRRMNASMLLIKTEERGLHRNCRTQRDSARKVES